MLYNNLHAINIVISNFDKNNLLNLCDISYNLCFDEPYMARIFKSYYLKKYLFFFKKGSGTVEGYKNSFGYYMYTIHWFYIY